MTSLWLYPANNGFYKDSFNLYAKGVYKYPRDSEMTCLSDGCYSYEECADMDGAGEIIYGKFSRFSRNYWFLG